jgi:antirestriction protein ArdC
MKRDLYAEVSTHIVAELEAGAAPWVKPWSATPGANTPCNAVSNRPYSGCNVVLLWMAQAAGYRTPRFLTFKQALELGGNVRKGEHGTKVYFVKQLQVQDKGADHETATHLVPMMREYTVFNVDQCENLPDSVNTGKANARSQYRHARRAGRCIPALNWRGYPGGPRRSMLHPEPGFYLDAGIRRLQGGGSLLQRGISRVDALVGP